MDVNHPKPYRPAGRRAETFSHQCHAAQHFAHRHLGGPACAGGFPGADAFARFWCPLCAKVLPKSKWSEDHAPIDKGTFTMGSATTCVITCVDCNNRAGHDYEYQAWRTSSAPELDIDLPGMASEVYGRRRVELHRDIQLYLVREEIPFHITDVKAGVLLAFAVLGHEWAAGPWVDPARAAIDAGMELDPRYGYTVRSTIGAGYDGQNLVIEVVLPQPAVVVRAATGLTVVLPAVGQQYAPQLGGNFTGRMFPWPVTTGDGAQVDAEHRAGHLFHLDFCDSKDHFGRPGATAPVPLPGGPALPVIRAAA